MENQELQELWNSYDNKMDRLLMINEEVAVHISKQKISTQMNKLAVPKWIAIFIGIPYTILLIAITSITFISQAYLMTLGFGAISVIMLIVLGNYFYQLILIHKIKGNEEVLSTQSQLAQLKLSSYNSLVFSIFQLPFWCICWVSIEAVKDSPYIYGGINLLVFILITALSFWLFNKLNINKDNNAFKNSVFSGAEWDPIVKSCKILEQINEYKK